MESIIKCSKCNRELRIREKKVWKSILIWYEDLKLRKAGTPAQSIEREIYAIAKEKLDDTSPWCLPECDEDDQLDKWFPPIRWIYDRAVEELESEMLTRIRERGRKPIEWLIEDHYSWIAKGREPGLHFWCRMQDVGEWWFDVDPDGIGPIENLSDDEYYLQMINKPSDFTNHEKRVLQSMWNTWREERLYALQMEGALDDDDE